METSNRVVDSSVDSLLLARYQDGDFLGFDEFYKRNSELIFVFLIHRLKSRSDAEDAFQETFLRIHRSITTYRRDQRALAWVFTIAKNAAIDIAKRRRNNVELMDSPADLPSIQNILESRDEWDSLLAKLTKHDQEIVRQRLLEDEEFETIAKVLKTSATNVRQKFSRIIRRLRSSVT